MRKSDIRIGDTLILDDKKEVIVKTIADHNIYVRVNGRVIAVHHYRLRKREKVGI